MIIFLTGSACAGKSAIRREIWPECKYVDVFEWQIKMYDSGYSGLKAAMEAEDGALNEFLDIIDHKSPEEVVIFESPLSSSDRRTNYAKLAREHAPDDEIICIVAEPEEKDIEFLVSKRVDKTDPDADEKTKKRIIKSMRDEIMMWRDFATPPSKEEGFDHVLKIVPIIRDEEETE